jgi:hypothetical protein
MRALAAQLRAIGDQGYGDAHQSNRESLDRRYPLTAG